MSTCAIRRRGGAAADVAAAIASTAARPATKTSARLMPRPCRMPWGGREVVPARSGSSWKNCGGRCTPFSPSLERNCGLMPLAFMAPRRRLTAPAATSSPSSRGLAMKRSCSVTTSPPCRSTSVMCVMRRVPSAQARRPGRSGRGPRRSARGWPCTGSSTPAISTMRLDARQRVARRVGVDGRERAVVARVHGLEHVERLGAADTRRR